MAATRSVTATILDSYSRIGLMPVVVMLMLVLCLVPRWTSNLPGASSRQIQPKRSPRGNQSSVRFVSMCPSNFDGRRLGNQLFNWAAVLYVARLSGGRPAMLRRHPHGWIDRWFDVADVPRVGNLSELCPCATVSERRGLTFESWIKDKIRSPPFINASALLICGYLQSWKYVVPVDDELRRRLRWKPNITAAVRRFLDSVRPVSWSNWSSLLRVGVHVRVGDVLSQGAFSYGFTVPAASYFTQAANYLTANVTSPVQFIVATNGLDWTKKNIGLEALHRNRSNTSVVYSEGHSAGFDMALLASCDVIIISTGSYGWWAAWLANTTNVYYRYWPRPGSYISTIFTCEDYFPPHWIGLGNESDLAQRRPPKLRRQKSQS